MITSTQSFATGGWGPNESFVEPDSGELYASLQGTHRSFETPCGSYAHFKLTRYLLRVTQDSRYGDSMERVLYNTVLGAKRLEPAGDAFYFSDYHAPATKTYFPDKWPCCAGTLPQVAADYRKLIYFRNGDQLFVNLYLPSTLRWVSHDGAQLALTQSGNYPFDGQINLRLQASRPTEISILFRIPEWSPGASIQVNGHAMPTKMKLGFAAVRRGWSGGDVIQLSLPLRMRLEPIESGHPETVALMRGPLVLFAITDNPPKVTRQQLLAAVQSAQQTWAVHTSSGAVDLRPFTAIEDEHYLTYLTVA